MSIHSLDDMGTGLEYRDIIYVEDAFKQMFSDAAMNEASPYLNEEYDVLEKLACSLSQGRKMNFCVVGGGSFQYLSLASKYFKKYVLVEPYLRCFVNSSFLRTKQESQNIECIEKKFEDYCCEFSKNALDVNTLYVFWFNVISYIKDPIECINKIIKNGDMVFISRWGESEEAQRVLRNYLYCINRGKAENAHKSLQVSPDIAVDKINYSSKIRFVKQKITTTVIVHI